MLGIRGFQIALGGFAPGVLPEPIETIIDKMLSLANVNEDGTLKEGTPEEVKQKIASIGTAVKIDNIYQRKSVFDPDLPTGRAAKRLYRNCLETALEKPQKTSILSQQEASSSYFIASEQEASSSY